MSAGYAMKITTKGQVTIPLYIRERTGLLPGTEIDFRIDDDGIVRLVKADKQRDNPTLRRTIERLRGSASTSMSTDQLMALLRG